MRYVSWTRKYKKMNILPGENKPIYGLDGLGIELVKDTPPLYDNGVIYIVDSVKDLVFDVISPSCRLLRRVSFDFNEAVTTADEFKKLYKEQDNGL